MTNPGPRAGVRGHLRLLAVVVAVVLLAGCDLATGTVRTATELRDAGIRNPDLQYDNGVARVEFDPAGGPAEALREGNRAAEVIWRNLPFRVDRITVTARGQDSLFAQRAYSRADLEARFGPRPAGLDQSPGDIARRVLLWASIAGLLLLLVVVLIIVLVVRAVRRRPPPQPAGAWQQPPAQPWGQPGYGQPPAQPGYGQPAAPQQAWGQPGPGQQTQPQWPQQPGGQQPAAPPSWGQPGGQQQTQPQWPQQTWGQPGYGQQTQPQWPQPAQQRPGAGEWGPSPEQRGGAPEGEPPPRQPGQAPPPEGEAPSEERDQGPVPPP
jgi:hypothetical protein